LFYFFLSRSLDLRDLHSFPTRRSSDLLFFNNQDRQRDFITGFSPTITLFINRPSYQVNGGYSFTAELYERESPLNNALNRQNFLDRKSTRLNSSHDQISYAVFCLKKKK